MRRGIRNLLLGMAALCVLGGLHTAHGQKLARPEDAVRKVTLLSHIANQDFERATFNFKLGVRGDSKSPKMNNVYDIRFDGISPDGHQGWLDVPIEHDYRSQIKDLGELNWAEVYDVPFLPALLVPHRGGMRFSYQDGGTFETSPDGVLARAIVGHIYLVHSKYGDTDFYAMFRVEEFKPRVECTITWKIVPSPEAR